MKTAIILTALIALAGIAQAASEKPLRQATSTELSTAQDRPNVLFIFADDQSYETIGAYGLTDIDTPNLDRLVNEGASFSHAYNMGSWSGAVCMASRACLNTGSFLWQASDDARECAQGKRPTWSQLMAEQGYQTYMSGKWHVGGVSAPKVFDRTGKVRAGMPKQKPAGYNRPKDEADYATGWKPWDKAQGGFWEGGTHWSEVLANETVAYLQEQADSEQPFFMYVAFNAPHDPRQAPKEYIDMYPLERIQLPENYIPKYPDQGPKGVPIIRDEKLMPFPRTEFAVKVNRQEYYASITHMDAQIGRILEALEASGKADNTWIIFSADHGLSVGHHGLVGKQNMYEDAMRAPFIVWGPGVEAGTKINAPIYIQDAMATALEISGQAAPEFIDYKSVLPLLDGRATQSYDKIYGAYINTQRMVLSGDWKLIAYPQLKKVKLFNVKKDPMEMHNLADNPEYAEKVQQLTAQLEDSMDAMGDPMTSLAKADFPKAKGKKSGDGAH
ncbi:MULTISPECIES: sulfatase-like hydrolase/transferase [unclassified Lentimonas]|uniref:sulfatase-like hydrolase/transferase n=1 Tax=unclassified Lentimonas TaxID=2630993 RepID=UPI00132370CD|nr:MULTISPECIES: sulfatase-like hydrolase/transferase [unclassified Lentimonas]CAA6677766.1 Choline-sulfatase (EC [Lentimonas sp. CC4]CAA6685030.1 Choline-sulfatase (EC [Lentimonas sp. CC6]CAA7077852.1 Choline-sulfatase (EC [Lentimonas sp. CC4]CAA7169780.1 Choline-sulfatase (EC [Lentimonas sp. CC21]CAA7179898.1 Choline-sulfatase (EC [Lentimonas sp. CC8]